MILKPSLLGCLLFSGLLFSQESIDLEKKADSIYFNQNTHTDASEFKVGLDLYNKILSSVTNKSSEYYNTVLVKKSAIKAAYLEHNMKYDSAIAYSKKSIQQQKNLKNEDLLLKGLTYKRLYKQWYALKQWDSVLPIVRETEKIFIDTLGNNHKLVADAVFDIGITIGKYGDYSKVIEQYKKAIDINIKTNGEFTVEAAIQEHHLALVYGFIGYDKKELESYKKVIHRWENIDYKDMSYLSVAYSSLSTCYLLHGDLKAAELYISKKEALVRRSKTNIKYWFNETFKGRTQLDIWYNLANLELHKRDTIKATFYNDKILDFVTNFDAADKNNNPHNLPYFKDFVNLSHIKALRLKAQLIQNKQPELAKKLYEEVLQIDNNPIVAETTLDEKLNIVDYYIATGKHKKAKEKLNLYINEANNRNSDYSLICLFAKQAKLNVLEDNAIKIDTIYSKVFKKLLIDSLQPLSLKTMHYKDCKPYGNETIVDITHGSSAHYLDIYRKTKKYADIEKAYNLSVLSSSMFSENFSYLPYTENSYQTVSKINEQLLSTKLLLQESRNVNDVLETIEQTNSRLSWKKFLASKQKENLNIPDSILEKENNLKSSLHFYKKALFVDGETSEEKIKTFKERIYDIETEIERLDAWYNANYPSYYNQTQRLFKVASLQENLKNKQQIIKYVIAEKHIYAFVINSETTKLFNLGLKEELSKKINNLITALTKINTQEYEELAKELYQKLLPNGVVSDTKKQSLIFIQDDILNFVPMEILINPKGNYLIQKHRVSYVPSLLLWEEQLKAKKSKKNKLGIFVPSYKNVKNKSSKRQGNSVLLGSKEEASKISKLFRSDLFSEEKATKKEFVNNAQHYSILHLAMHSNIDNTTAEFSNLSFSSKDSDKLFISELYNMSLNADLAVLSACNTGSGKLEKGEGLTNVSKAFTYAGVPSIVMSLWEVPDIETSQIMVSFYKNLKEGYSKNEALQLAKLEYLNTVEDVALKHPFYWAGFVISGDVSPIEIQANYALIFSIITFGLLALFFLKKKRLI